MRLILRAVVFVSFALVALAPSLVVADEATTMQAEREIRAQYQLFTDAWNRHDTDTIGRMWVADGDHLEPDGRGVRGQTSVAALFKEQHASVFKKTTLALTIDSVWLVTPDVAVADGTYAIDGIVAPDGKPIPKREGHLTSNLVRKDGKWWIAGSRLMVPTKLPYKSS